MSAERPTKELRGVGSGPIGFETTELDMADSTSVLERHDARKMRARHSLVNRIQGGCLHVMATAVTPPGHEACKKADASWWSAGSRPLIPL